MLADWHAHYPMRVIIEETPATAGELMKDRRQPTVADRLRALVLRVASRLFNQPSWDGRYRVSPEALREGDVRLAMSVLFRAFEEMDLSKRYASPPTAGYFPKLLADLEAVEREVTTHDRAQIRLVHKRAELDECLRDGATALVHCVEGGFHLGDSEEEVERNCAELSARGVVYVTVAHLFFRQVATNANAVPFIPDRLYDLVFPQRGSDRLTPRGEALVRGLVRNRILVDLSHMDPPGIRETLALMDRLDPAGEVPVVSTHAGYRFGKQRYMHDEETLLAIKRRNGIVGLIMAQHQLNDGLRGKRDHTETLDESLDVIGKHIEEIARVTGGYDHIAIGTDFDGFVKPTPGGLETLADMKHLERGLRERFGDENAERIVWKNTLRVLETIWPRTGAAPA